MASNDEYQQNQFWQESFCSVLIRETKRKILEERERLFYTAKEGSVLDRIWKGEFNNELKQKI